MVVDSSALVAIVLREPPWPALLQALERAETRRLSAVNQLESAIVVESRFGLRQGRDLDTLLQSMAIEIVAVTAGHVQIARVAHRRFGKGNHPAGLNFGDCFAYALARELDEPLLFVGTDFDKTDIRPALQD